MKRSILLLAILVLGVNCARAQFLPEIDPFVLMDSNRDSFLSFDEFTAIYPQFERAFFDRLDQNQDAKLSQEEWAQFSILVLEGLVYSGPNADMGLQDPVPPVQPRAPGLSPPQGTNFPTAPSDLEVGQPAQPDLHLPRPGPTPNVPGVREPSVPGPQAPSVPQVRVPQVEPPKAPSVPVPE